jgi:hypothetical protein
MPTAPAWTEEEHVRLLQLRKLHPRLDWARLAAEFDKGSPKGKRRGRGAVRQKLIKLQVGIA